MIEIKELYNLFVQSGEITTDSRNCPAGSIFFALRGETFNGNLYAADAIRKGCAYAVVDDESVKSKELEEAEPSVFERLLLVDDVLLTLQKLANYHRRQIGTTIIGVTGTNGKTTTKELISAVLSKKFNVLYTQGNFNNHIGVPKTLLGLTRSHDIAVVEMGANHPGEIKTLVNIVEPNYGIITNVGKAHLLGFGSFEGVIRTKGELYDFIREHDGKVFINENNPYLMGISSGLELIKYSNTDKLIDCSPYLKFDYEGNEVQTQLIGAYNIDNALAAATIGRYFGVPVEAICDALREYVPSNNRSQLKKTEKNTLIIDAYNANPTSMMAALDNFSKMKAGNKMAVLGDMKELGEASEEEHTKILKFLAENQFEMVWLVGTEFRNAYEKNFGNVEGNASETDFAPSFFADAEQVKACLAEKGIEGKTILIKGSNSTRLFSLVDSF